MKTVTHDKAIKKLFSDSSGKQNWKKALSQGVLGTMNRKETQQLISTMNYELETFYCQPENTFKLYIQK